MSGKCPPGCKCGKHAHVVRTSYEKTCEECGAPFTAKYANARFCSGQCRQRCYERENREQIRKHHREYMATHREQRRETRRRYEEKHGDRDRAAKRQRYTEDMADPEKAAARRVYYRRYYQDNRERILEQKRQDRAQGGLDKRRSQHGTDWEPLFNSLWEAQGGKCYLCGDALQRDAVKAIHLDHSHECCELGRSCGRCRRGLACKRCNLIIGMAKDDPERLLRIAMNLREANEGVRRRMLLPRRPVEPKSYDLNCLECGEPFTAYRSDNLCCSAKCYERMRYRQRRGVA